MSEGRKESRQDELPQFEQHVEQKDIGKDGKDEVRHGVAGTGAHYRQPGWFTRNVANRAVAGLTRAGLSIWGSRVLEVPGRSSGKLQRIPVNVLELDGNRYLVSARGEGQWVRNVRAASGHIVLVLGRRRTPWVATEIMGAEKTPV
ncbi:MAG: nitroreductase/quinone reductase family protein, partial [Mycobacterium sp.]